MRISVFTRIFVLGGAAFLALSQPSVGRGGHGGGGHSGGGHSGGFHGGRLPTASRAGHQTVQRRPEASSRARLASGIHGGRLPTASRAGLQTVQRRPEASSTSLSRGESTVRGSTTDRHGGATDSAADSHRDTAAQAAESSRDHSPQRRQAMNDRRDYWNRWGNENDRRVQQFKTDRERQWSGTDHFWRGRNMAQTYNSRDWRDYRDRMAAFRDDRRMEIWNGVRDYHDDLFDNGWWAGCGWWPGVLPGPFIGGFWDPWWWWGACSWNTMTGFLDWGWSQPITYDYDVNVVDEGDIVYLNGQPEGSTTQYEQQDVELANPQNPPPPPAPDQGWTPLGVWALCQEEKGDADMFVQLSVNKAGQISGAYTNVLTGEKEPVAGQIDKATQRVAFHLGKNTDSVVEAGAYNLTQDVASCKVYFGKAKPQTWLFVGLPAPKTPDAPTPVRVTSTSASTGNAGAVNTKLAN
jgi:hypothetical protein